MIGESVILESIEVGPSYEITKLSNLAKAQSTYDGLPQNVRDAIDLSYYVMERRSRKIIVGPALEKLKFWLVSSPGQDLPLAIGKNGEVEIPPFRDPQRDAQIISNAPKDRIDVGFRLSIKIPADAPLTLGHLRASTQNFLKAYKPYAGIVLRTFIGNHKPNCFGMSFSEPQSVIVRSPNSTEPIWSSQPATRVTVFFSDIPTNDPDVVIAWTGKDAPYFTAACLLNRNRGK